MVSPLIFSLSAFACIFGGTLFGMWLRFLLPDHHLSDESEEAVKLGTGMIATLAALVLGLLIASAKGSFDTITNEMKLSSSKLVLLDRNMAQYGPETREARDLLRHHIAFTIQRFWPEETQKAGIAITHQPGNETAAAPGEPDAQYWLQSAHMWEAIQDKLRHLSPHNNNQRWLQSRALQISADIAETRWIIHGQIGQRSIPTAFLAVLVCWLSIIFASFGLFSPRNGTVIFVMLICALSAAAALFLILELDQPYHGLIRISSDPFVNALEAIRR